MPKEHKIHRLQPKDGTVPIGRVAEIATSLAKDPKTQDMLVLAFGPSGAFSIHVNHSISAERLLMAAHIISSGVEYSLSTIDEPSDGN